MKTTTLALAGIVSMAAVGGVGWLAFGARGDEFAECRAGSGLLGADVGAPFELTSHAGARVSSEQVFDRPTLVYFGYTFCPDVCPADAMKMAMVKGELKAEGRDVGVVFITIDPGRDTPERLAEFTSYFDPEMVGLTGSEEDISKVTRDWRVYRARVDDDPEYYLMDHSAFTYMVAPGRGVVDFFRHEATAEEVTERARCYVDALS